MISKVFVYITLCLSVAAGTMAGRTCNAGLQCTMKGRDCVVQWSQKDGMARANCVKKSKAGPYFSCTGYNTIAECGQAYCDTKGSDLCYLNASDKAMWGGRAAFQCTKCQYRN